MDVCEEGFNRRNLITFRKLFELKSVYHLLDTLRAEGVFCVNVKTRSAKTSKFRRELTVYCHLMNNLGFTGTKFTIYFSDCLCFETSFEHFVELRHKGFEF